uniref:SCP domain-containing protein n=1 Tax=Pristionchus pacificus TaxID=54126 RepID=A0A8R1Y776_PRIPA
MRLLLIVPLLSLLPGCALAAPSKTMCNVLYRFVEQYHADRASVAAWLSTNCYRIRQRPADMSCADMITFARDCQYSLTQEVRTETYNRYLASVQPTTLHKYIHHNRQTVYDYGHFGNAWMFSKFKNSYMFRGVSPARSPSGRIEALKGIGETQHYYPNYTPWHEISGLYGTPRAQAAQLENEWQWTRGGNYPYMRADNVVNQALQQTMLPTCLHDVIYCAKLSIAQQQAARAANAAASDPSILQYDYDITLGYPIMNREDEKKTQGSNTYRQFGILNKK